MTEALEFSVAHPPPSLRANSRAHWARKKREADAYAIEVMAAFYEDVPPSSHETWDRARVTYTWKHAGVAPDHSNLGGHTKYLQDIICMVPKSAPASYTRWHLGLVENDSGIEAVFKSEKVAHRDQEAVIVRIERMRG